MACVCGHGKENMEEYLAPLKKILEKYPGEERYLIPILQEAQEAYGYLPKDVLRRLPIIWVYLSLKYMV